MRIFRQYLPIFLVLMQQVSAYERPVFPFAPAATETGSVALHKDDPGIVGWATSVIDVTFGEEVADEWKHPENALGPASGKAEDVVVLGRGGEIILSFEGVIQDGPGDDFAVFENSLDDTFLELAYVEVSSDGTHYVRFPNYSMTAAPVGSFGTVQATHVHGFAGKYRAGFGTPFDLAILQQAHEAALSGSGGFSQEFRSMLLENYPFLDLDGVRHVRIIDIPGDGSCLDSEGFAIFDPYPTVITSGFDLDAVAVLHKDESQEVGFDEWSNSFGLVPEQAADTDGDKWSQYLEYLFGTDPRSGNSRPVVQTAVIQSGDESVLRVTVVRKHSRHVEQVLEIQVSHDAQIWTQWENARVVSGLENDASMVTEWIEIPIEAGNPVWVRFTATN